jgi:hypothetical protein
MSASIGSLEGVARKRIGTNYGSEMECGKISNNVGLTV